MHVDQVEGILALFLVCLRQIATSKKLFNRLSGFLDNIHDALLFRMHKSCARIVCPAAGRQKVRPPKKMPSCGFRCFRETAHAAGWWDPRKGSGPVSRQRLAPRAPGGPSHTSNGGKAGKAHLAQPFVVEWGYPRH